jgi:tetratricopeptide (TPR) repeat protein
MTYGRSFANKLIQDGAFEAAIDAATQALASEDDNPEHFVDRATAYVALGRDAEAVDDFVRALTLDAEAQILETDLIDDAYFSALLAAARTERDIEAGCARLGGYRDVLPAGRHLTDAEEWTQRLRGERKSTFTKVREI